MPIADIDRPPMTTKMPPKLKNTGKPLLTRHFQGQRGVVRRGLNLDQVFLFHF